MSSGAKWFWGLLTLGGLTILGLNLYEKTQAVKNFTVDFLSFRNPSFSSGKFTFDSTLSISNSSTHTVDVSRIAGNVFYNGYNIGVFSSPDNFKVNPGSQDFKLNIQTPILNTLINIPAFVLGITSGKEQPLNFKGFITAMHLQIPIDFVYNVPAIELKAIIKQVFPNANIA